MAKFSKMLPDKEIKAFENMYNNSEEVIGKMTRIGAEVAMKNMKAKAPIAGMANHIKLTRTYKTPSDGGINTKVYFSGYLPFSDPKRKYFARRAKKGGPIYYTDEGVPVDFLAKISEYGRSDGKFPKKPFVRSSFDDKRIEKAMTDYQEQKIDENWGAL